MRKSFENICDEKCSIKYALGGRKTKQYKPKKWPSSLLSCDSSCIIALFGDFLIGYPQVVSKLFEESFFVFKFFDL